MRLTCFLARKGSIPGKIWTGKHRIAHKPTAENAERLHKRFAIEEQNMFYLRHAFLSPEQEHGFAKVLGKREKWLAKVKEEVVGRPYRPHATLEDRLVGPLKVSNSWD